jgi:hypothetical protein
MSFGVESKSATKAADAPARAADLAGAEPAANANGNGSVNPAANGTTATAAAPFLGLY